MKRIKIFLPLCLIALLLPVLPTATEAAQNLNVTVSAPTDMVTVGEEFTVTVSLSGYTGEDPIVGLQADICLPEQLEVVNHQTEIVDATATFNETSLQTEAGTVRLLYVPEGEAGLPVTTEELYTVTFRLGTSITGRGSITLPLTAKLRTESMEKSKQVNPKVTVAYSVAASITRGDSTEYFASLTDALTEIMEGDVLTLLAQPEADEQITQKVTIVPNGFSIPCAEGWSAVENADGTWTVVQQIKLFTIESSNIVLGNELAMYFYVSNTDLTGEDYVAVVTKTYADGREDVVEEIPYAEWEDTSNNRKRFKFNGIAAKEMGDYLVAVIKDNDGTVLSETYTDSIQKYIERGFETGNAQKDAKLATMLVDMLNYGAAAQNMFTYNKAHPANENMGAYQEYATKSVSLNNKQEKGQGFKSMSLVLESNISMLMFFEKAHVTKDMTAVVTFTDHYRKTHEIEVAGRDFEDRGSKGWAIIINELVVADGCQMVTCEFKDANGNKVEGVYGIDSMESMCARAVAGGGGTYYEDIMKFSMAAYSYFH